MKIILKHEVNNTVYIEELDGIKIRLIDFQEDLLEKNGILTQKDLTNNQIDDIYEFDNITPNCEKTLFYEFAEKMSELNGKYEVLTRIEIIN